VQAPYVAIGLFVLCWAAVVAATRFPPEATRPAERDADAPHWWEAITGAFARPGFLFAVVAQFFYVGAQVGVWSFTIRYAQEATGMGERAAADWVIAAIVTFVAGRFIGTALMGRISPPRLLGAYAVIAGGLALVAVASPGYPGLVALTAISFFMSVMFPTIFALGVKGLGPYTQTGSSFIVMAIVGGAALTPLMGAISRASTMHMAISVPAVCFLVVAFFALTRRRTRPVEKQELGSAAAA
jgi:FHS family L-fucose permease-like MFS transporter